MGKAVTVRLTSTEAQELRSLLGMILSNGDQWSFLNLASLRRVDKKINA